MSRCAIKGCVNAKFTGGSCRRKILDVSFHRVPNPLKRPKDYLRWAEKINKNLNSRSSVCSIHFEDGDYMNSPTVRKLLSQEGRPTLRPGVVPHLNLDIRRKAKLRQRNENDLNEVKEENQEWEHLAKLRQRNENDLNEVKEENQEWEHFPQETVYLPASSTEFFHEYSDSEESNASSEEEPAEEVPFQERTYMSQPVQCELGIEKYRGYLDDSSADEDEPANQCTSTSEDVASQQCFLTGDSTSEALTGILTGSNVTLCQTQYVQCELGQEVYRWKTRRVVSYGLYDMCLSGGNCPCGRPKQDGGRVALKRRKTFFSSKNEKSYRHEDNSRSEKRNSYDNDDDNSRSEKRNSYDNDDDNSRSEKLNSSDNNEDNSKSEKRNSYNNNACLVCKKSKLLHVKEPKPKPTFFNVTDFPRIRKEVASIIHKRSTPNILRRNQRTN